MDISQRVPPALCLPCAWACARAAGRAVMTGIGTALRLAHDTGSNSDQTASNDVVCGDHAASRLRVAYLVLVLVLLEVL
jgi:hypothetical protein